MDPMCGSGTFAIEAGLWTAGVPIHAGRREWTLFGMPSFDVDLWREVGEASRQERIERAPILASDWNKQEDRQNLEQKKSPAAVQAGIFYCD